MSGPLVLGLRLLLTISLYLFLVWAFNCVWRDIRLQGQILANRRVPLLGLTLIQEGSPPKTQRFNRADVTIGRDPACECSIPDHALSARHARLSFHHNQWWIEDLGSTNGTLLNQIKITLPTVIISGDEVQCGKTDINITIADNVLVSPDHSLP